MILLKYSTTLQPTLGSAGLQTREGGCRQSAKAPGGKVCKSHSWAPRWHRATAEEETRDCQLISSVHLEGLVSSQVGFLLGLTYSHHPGTGMC